MNFMDRVANFITGGRIQKTESRLADLREAVSAIGKYELTMGSMERLAETDSELLDMLVRQRGYEYVVAGGKRYLSDQERIRDVDYSRYLFLRDVTQQRVVRMWTDIGFGTRVRIDPQDEAAKEPWDEFWTARRNGPIVGQTVISRNSDTLLVDGEVFFVYFISTLDGKTTVRRIPTEKITEIITDPDDPDIPVYYVWERESGVVWVPDWQATEEQLLSVEIKAPLADTIRPQTKVLVQHLAYNQHGQRGWPQFKTAWEWIRVYTQFLGDRAAVARKAAMYTEKVKVKGGQRALDAIRTKLESSLTQTGNSWERNPAPVAASDWIENDGVTRDWMTRDTGSAGAQTDSMMFVGQISLATGIPPHFLGRPDSMQNRATARESALPWYEQMQRYQLFWSQAFEDMCEIVLRGISEFGVGAPEFETYASDVSLESHKDLQVEDVAGLMAAVDRGVAAMSILPDVAQNINREMLRIALNSLGSRDPDALLESVAPPPGVPMIPGGPVIPGAEVPVEVPPATEQTSQEAHDKRKRG